MRGRDTSQLRAYNKRMVLNLLLSNGAKSKADIARKTGLSAQGSSIIVNALLDDGLLIKLDKIRGQIGQPSTPVAPNPNGAYSLGVHLGRRDIGAVLVNLVGEVIHAQTEPFVLSSPDESFAAAVRLARGCLDKLNSAAQDRVVGLGVAIPCDLHLWTEELALPPESLDGWRKADVAGALSAATGLPVTVYNDATAACGAEMIAGSSINSESAIYIYLGAFIGGGVVIDGKLYRGEQFKAGAIGSIPTSRTGRSGRPDQLIRWASIVQLESSLNQAGLNGWHAIYDGGVPEAEPYFEEWANEAACELTRAVVSAMGIIDFRTIVVDGLLNADWKNRFAWKIQGELDQYDRSGLAPASIQTGSIGRMASVIGAARLPLEEWVAPDSDRALEAWFAPVVEGPSEIRNSPRANVLEYSNGL